MSKANSAQSVRMRILVVDTPPDAWFAVQRGRSDLLEPLGGQQQHFGSSFRFAWVRLSRRAQSTSEVSSRRARPQTALSISIQEPWQAKSVRPGHVVPS